MSSTHLVDIRACPCLICGRPAGIAHHLLSTGEGKERGMGRTEADKWAVPLCARHHDQQFPHSVHREGAGDEDGYFARYGIDGRAAARALWRLRGKQAEMIATIEKIRSAARLKLLQQEYYGL